MFEYLLGYKTGKKIKIKKASNSPEKGKNVHSSKSVVHFRKKQEHNYHFHNCFYNPC
jgi:hypothetical protein